MNRDEVISKLEKLIHLDIDATHAYDQAIKNIREQSIKDNLILFMREHSRHVEVLSAKILELGEIPPESSPDFKGYFITGFTALRSLSGTKGALNAMESNERLTTSTYEDASRWDVSPDIAAIISTHLADERRHLMFIREKLSLFKV